MGLLFGLQRGSKLLTSELLILGSSLLGVLPLLLMKLLLEYEPLLITFASSILDLLAKLLINLGLEVEGLTGLRDAGAVNWPIDGDSVCDGPGRRLGLEESLASLVNQTCDIRL